MAKKYQVPEDYYTGWLTGQFRPYDLQYKEKNILRYCIMMLNRTINMFEYENLPDTIPKRILERYLQLDGKTLFFEHEGSYYVAFGNWSGLPDEYYEPKHYIVNNPYLPINKEFTIGEDSILIKNDSCMFGLRDTFRAYATQMAENDLSIRIADINSRMISILTTPDDNTKQSAEQFFKKVESGELSALPSSDFLKDITSVPYASGSSASVSLTSLIELQQYLKASWMNDIGLNSNFNMKRESLNSGETDLNEDSLLPTPADMLQQRKIACEQINDMYGLNIKVELASAWKKHESLVTAEVESLTGEGEYVDSVDESELPDVVEDITDVSEDIQEEPSSEPSDEEPKDEAPEEPSEEPETVEEIIDEVESIKDTVDEIKDTVEEIKEEVVEDDNI